MQVGIAEMVTRHGISYLEHISNKGQTLKVKRIQNLSTVLLNTVARFEVSRLNQGQPVFDRVAMEYIGNNAYEVLENPDTDF